MFMCEFNRQIFTRILELKDASDGDFDVGELGQFFNPEQMGAITKMRLNRAQLENNSPEVLNELITRLEEQNRKNKSDDIPLEEYFEALRAQKS